MVLSVLKKLKLKLFKKKKISKEKLQMNETKINYDYKLDRINNEGLKNSLNKLIEAYNAKNN